MKKITLCFILIMSTMLLTSCNNTKAFLTASDIKVNTILVNKDGTVETGIVEDFDKEYYSEKDLETFIENQIKDYNTLAGKNCVKKNHFEIKNNKAKAILSYKNIEDYRKFNRVDAFLFTAKEAKRSNLIPKTFIEASEGKTVDMDVALSSNKYKVFIISEPCDIIVYGKVLYYSNAVLLNSKSVQSTDNNYSVVVFKN